MMEPLLVLNIGWMEKYKGLEEDQLIGGGAYVWEHGLVGRYLIFCLLKDLCTDLFNHLGEKKFLITVE